MLLVSTFPVFLFTYASCLQDLYLIDPPAGAMHTAVLPSLIVFAGDSAGGGLCLAVLQVIFFFLQA